MSINLNQVFNQEENTNIVQVSSIYIDIDIFTLLNLDPVQYY